MYGRRRSVGTESASHTTTGNSNVALPAFRRPAHQNHADKSMYQIYTNPTARTNSRTRHEAARPNATVSQALVILYLNPNAILSMLSPTVRVRLYLTSFPPSAVVLGPPPELERRRKASQSARSRGGALLDRRQGGRRTRTKGHDRRGPQHHHHNRRRGRSRQGQACHFRRRSREAGMYMGV